MEVDGQPLAEPWPTRRQAPLSPTLLRRLPALPQQRRQRLQTPLELLRLPLLLPPQCPLCMLQLLKPWLPLLQQQQHQQQLHQQQRQQRHHAQRNLPLARQWSPRTQPQPLLLLGRVVCCQAL